MKYLALILLCAPILSAQGGLIFGSSNAKKIQGVSVKAPLGCTDGQVLKYIAANLRFECAADSGGSGSGDVSGGTNLTTAGAVPYVSASGTLNQDAANLFWDSSNVRLGIGTNAPATELTVRGNSTSDPRGIMSWQYSNDAIGARIHFRKDRAGAIVQTGDMLGRIRASGYDGSNYLQMASIDFVASGTVASTRVPTDLVFSTGTDAAPSVLTERMRISNAGVVSITGSQTVSGSITGGGGTPSANYPFLFKRNTNLNLGIGSQSGEMSLEAFNDAVSANIPLRLYSTTLSLYATTIGVRSDGIIKFSSSTDAASTKDTGIMRGAAALVLFGNGSVAATTNFAGLAWDATNGFTIKSGANSTTYNDTNTSASGTVANRYIFGLGAPTLTATNSSTTNTVASTVYIGGAPTASTNVTIGTAYALNVAAGNSLFGGNVTTSGDVIGASTTAMYFGASGTDGSWRFVRSGNNLVVERRESGVWTTKGTWAP